MGVPDLLRRSPIFAEFDDETLERLSEPFSEVEFPADHVLIEPRTPGAGLFVICDGTVVAEAHGRQRELGPGDVEPDYRGSGVPSGEIDRQYLDSMKIREQIGWKPEVELREGLERTLDWYAANPEVRPATAAG